MITSEINDYLDRLEESGNIENNDFLILKNLSSDSDIYIRSRIPIIMMDFVNEESLTVLFSLAKDSASLVRIEAYDSLSIFPYQEVIDFLRAAINKEKNALARSYAILSWAESVVSLGQTNSSVVEYALKKKSKEKNKICILSWLYALCILGEKFRYQEILIYLNDRNYHVRRHALSLLSDILDECNFTEIKSSIKLMLENEHVPTVRDKGVEILSFIKTLTK